MDNNKGKGKGEVKGEVKGEGEGKGKVEGKDKGHEKKIHKGMLKNKNKNKTRTSAYAYKQQPLPTFRQAGPIFPPTAILFSAPLLPYLISRSNCVLLELPQFTPDSSL